MEKDTIPLPPRQLQTHICYHYKENRRANIPTKEKKENQKSMFLYPKGVTLSPRWHNCKSSSQWQFPFQNNHTSPPPTWMPS